ncbi:hypothetical protein [Limobrevibacterium gyesilva]|uniref:Uncharacterized protein n=1 Tax=Limobrevibacterium gyesilva TaxID=2991712 RepID=A0AA42CE65_9PROT|nr:hypothetical protein [Limobrevibacterium gyesilva]MCW3473101.1 hypothetical protein [Limobrevibacterium gyesilva]
MANGKTCLRCRFWHLDAEARAKAAEKLQSGTVALRIRKDEVHFFPCRRYPPVPDPRRAMLPQGMPPSHWPMTAAGDWCGEWQGLEAPE